MFPIVRSYHAVRGCGPGQLLEGKPTGAASGPMVGGASAHRKWFKRERDIVEIYFPLFPLVILFPLFPLGQVTMI